MLKICLETRYLEGLICKIIIKNRSSKELICKIIIKNRSKGFICKIIIKNRSLTELISKIITKNWSPKGLIYKIIGPAVLSSDMTSAYVLYFPAATAAAPPIFPNLTNYQIFQTAITMSVFKLAVRNFAW